MYRARFLLLTACCLPTFLCTTSLPGSDYIRELQTQAIKENRADFGHWGHDQGNYKMWASHSNRLIPVYTFGTLNGPEGVDLRYYQWKNSPYRSEAALQRIYGRVPPDTLNSNAEYFDQTDVFRIQLAGLTAGKKNIFLVVFDGMDWQTTRAAAIYKTQSVGYKSGRGYGLHLQDYTANETTQFGFMCTSPHNNGTSVDTNDQSVKNPGGNLFGGYSVTRGGPNPWTPGTSLQYPISTDEVKSIRHAYTDSSSSATSMTAGIKTYNNAVNVDYAGHPVQTIAHLAQEKGYGVGAVSSVPISHATPASAYAHNVHRDDYQDLTRDMLGLKSISHPETPLPGLDVVIGGGFGDVRNLDGNSKEATAGTNFVPGNVYLTNDDLKTIDVANGGKYVTSIRTAGAPGKQNLQAAAEQAANHHHRLLGFYGVGKYGGHLPFATADGDFKPTVGRSDKAEEYELADLHENPSLTDMTTAAITVLSKNPKGFWLMVEAGDVDWANHDDNIDNSIGAVLSGDAAVKTITDWVDQHSNWNESLLIVTSDHGHYLVLEKPELLVETH